MENKINPVEGQLTIIDGEGNERLCQILFTLNSEEFGKKYVVFYPIEQLEGDDDDQVQLMAASYTEGEDGTGELKEIETEEEWQLIEDAVGSFEDEMCEDEECECHCGCHHDEECEEECDEDEECHHNCCCHHHE